MNFDVVVVGSGLVGLIVVLYLVDYCCVVVISKCSLLEGVSDWVQGGIVVVFDLGDSYDEYVDDMFIVGVGLCDEVVICYIVENGCLVIEWLIGYGVFFICDEQVEFGFYLMCEGGYCY